MVIISTICIATILHSAEPKPNRPGMPKEYALGNKYQIKCFLHWLKESNIPIKDKTVISFGCGTIGEIEAKLAGQAKYIHGIDASKEMVDYAQATHAFKTHNLSFEHCFAENFQPLTLHDVAFAASSFHWFEDKPKALRAIAKSLQPDGIFFANIETKSNPKPFGITVFEEMKQDVPIIGSLLALLPNPTGSSHPTHGELHVMLTQAGFTDIKSQEKSYDWKMTAEEWRKAQLPLLLTTPGAQMLVNTTSDNWYAKKASEGAFWLINMSQEERAEHDAPFFPESNHELVQKIRTNDFCRYLFNNFLRRCLTKLQKNADDTYTWNYQTMIISAKKK